jgi:hypothetical protein
MEKCHKKCCVNHNYMTTGGLISKPCLTKSQKNYTYKKTRKIYMKIIFWLGAWAYNQYAHNYH